MTTRVAILDDYLNVALEVADWDRLKGKAEVTVFTEHLADADAAAKALADFDIVVAMRERMPLPASLIEKLPKLKLIVTTGMRNFSIDMDAARARGIDVCGTRGQGHPTAELTWGLILGWARHIPSQFRSMREGGWQTEIGSTLRDKTLGVIGLGKLGGQVAAVGRALGMKVIAWSQNLTAERAAEHGATLVDKDELLRTADVATIHLVLSDRTRGLLGARELRLMKPTALLVNTSRGPIVEEAALLDALRNRRIAGAAIDVYGKEPLAADHPLRKLDNVLLTPHIGYVTRDNFAVMYGDAVEDIDAFLDGRTVRALN